MRVRWTAPAARALEAVIDYIARDNPQVAFQVAQCIGVAVEQLSLHPKLGRAGRVRGTRELIIHDIPCIVPYRIGQNEIEVLSVDHGRRGHGNIAARLTVNLAAMFPRDPIRSFRS